MLTYLIILVVAHLLGDFLLQPDKLCGKKLSPNIKQRMSALVIHAGVQAMMSYLLVAEWSLWLLPVVIFISHFTIDLIKVGCGGKSLPSFMIDQFAHYVMIFLVWKYMIVTHASTMPISYLSQNIWIVLVAYIAILTPSSVLIKYFMEYEGWIPKVSSIQGMPNAGKWIGYLERILILTFIFTDNVEGIGFLLAAKSIFRFGELNKSKDLKITEYVLIGTFVSFTLSILIGFSAKWLMSINCEF